MSLPPWYIKSRQQEAIDDVQRKMEERQHQRPFLPALAATPGPPTGMQLQWMPGVGGEDEQQGGGLSDIGALLGNYLKKRQQGRQTDLPAATPGNVA